MNVTLDREEADARLLDRYMEVLDLAQLVRMAREETQGALSGLFLPAVDERYLRSKVRVMLIGKEPRAWGKSLHRLADEVPTPTLLRDYVREQMLRHRAFAQRAHSTSKFRQFHTQLSAQLGEAPEAVVWGNLLCASLDKGSPVGASTFPQLAELSRALLAAQLEVLAPDLVVFASGYRYDQFIKQLLPQYRTLPGLVPKQFWPFAAGGFTACRIIHPQRHTREYVRFVLGAVRVQVEDLRSGRTSTLAPASPTVSLDSLLLGPQARAAASDAVRQAVAKADAAGLPPAYEPDFSTGRS